MSYPIPKTTPIDPPREFVDVIAGIYFRSIFLEHEGTVVPQHSHDHDHATYIGSGRVRLWIDGDWDGDYEAGGAILIQGGREHLFMALEKNTRLTCVWPEAIGATFTAPD